MVFDSKPVTYTTGFPNAYLPNVLECLRTLAAQRKERKILISKSGAFCTKTSPLTRAIGACEEPHGLSLQGWVRAFHEWLARMAPEF